MFQIGDIVRIIKGWVFVGRLGVVESLDDGFIQVGVSDTMFIFDFTEDELEHA